MNPELPDSSNDAILAVDLVIQLVCLGLVFIRPWFLHDRKTGSAFAYAFLAFFVWGIWRILHFDIVTGNDVPGMGYIIAALIYGGVAALVYHVAGALRRWRKRGR